jgi:hypothetical protein
LKEELNNILSSLKNGKISIDKANTMIDNLYKPVKGRMLYIIINEDANKEPTKLTMPIKFVSMIIRNFGKIPNLNIKGLEELDSEKLAKLILMAIEQNAIGQLVELKNSENQSVKISIL